MGALLIGVAAVLPWARYGPEGSESVSLFRYYEGDVNVVFIAVALSIGVVYRARSVNLRRVAYGVALFLLAGMIVVAALDVARGDSLVRSSGWVVRNDVSAGPGPFVVIAGALLLGFAVLSRQTLER